MNKLGIRVLQFSYSVVLTLFISCKGHTQQNVVDFSANKKEVIWNKNINDALSLAKKQNKLLFVECYSPTCPVCLSIEPLFKDSEIANHYNSRFVNYKLNLTDAEQLKFLDSKKIWLPSYPQFLFFDGDGKLVHQSEVIPDIKTLINVAETAEIPENRAGNYKSKFEKGERNIDLLIQLSSFSRIIQDTATNLIVAETLFKLYPKDQMGSETSWRITKKCVTDIDNGFAQYWFEHSDIATRFETKDGHPGNQNNILGGIIQSSLYSSRSQNYGVEKINIIKKYMKNSGAGQYTESALWEFETKALIREGKPELALTIGEKMAAKFGANGQSLVYIARIFNDFYPNKNYAPKATAWLNKAKGLLKEDKFLAEYYFESAKLNQKTGDLAKAKADAQQARNLASKAQVDLTKFSALIEKL